MLALAQSTHLGYDRVLDKCKHYTESSGTHFPPTHTCYLADFLCSICDNSDRPRSILNTALAALSHVYRTLEQQDLTKDAHIVRLTTALVKSQTVRPMKKSTVLPVDRFTEMFRSWGSNDSLSLKHLRLKAITLLALALMLRPSDEAPKATIFHANTGDIQTVPFTTDMLEFRADGVNVTFFGIKKTLRDLESKCSCHDTLLQSLTLYRHRTTLHAHRAFVQTMQCSCHLNDPMKLFRLPPLERF